MVIITIFSLLIFSSILNALSKLYLSRDLKLVHAMPVEGYTGIFHGKVGRKPRVDSSWMVILYTLPPCLWPMDLILQPWAVFLHHHGDLPCAALLYCILLWSISCHAGGGDSAGQPDSYDLLFF